MERTLEGWRQAGEIVSRWVWIHLKVGEPEGADISSMSELAREKPHMASRDTRACAVASSLSPGEGRKGHCVDIWLWGFGESREERESMALHPRASSSFTVGGIWEMRQGSYGTGPHIGGWDGRWLYSRR